MGQGVFRIRNIRRSALISPEPDGRRDVESRVQFRVGRLEQHRDCVFTARASCNKPRGVAAGGTLAAGARSPPRRVAAPLAP